MSTLQVNQEIQKGGVNINAVSVVLQSADGSYGIRRTDTGATVVAAGTAYTNLSTGIYEYVLDNADDGVTYEIATQITTLDPNTGNNITTQLVSWQTSESVDIVSSDEVLAEMGLDSPTAGQIQIVKNAIIKTQGAIRQFLGFDPILRQHSEYHPQQPFQSQISRGIWEVMEQRAVLRQVAESATNELQVQHLPVRECLPPGNPTYLYDSFGNQLILQSSAINGFGWWRSADSSVTLQFSGNGWNYINSAQGLDITQNPGPTGSYIVNQENTVVITAMAILVDYDGRAGSRPKTFPLDSNRSFGYGYWPNWDSFDSKGFKVCTDGVIRALGLWPTTPSTVQCTYVAGYTNAEFHGNGELDASPIWDAALTESVRRARRVIIELAGKLGVVAGALQSETIGEYSYSMSSDAIKRLYGGALLPESIQKLNRFFNWGAALGM